MNPGSWIHVNSTMTKKISATQSNFCHVNFPSTLTGLLSAPLKSFPRHCTIHSGPKRLHTQCTLNLWMFVSIFILILYSLYNEWWEKFSSNLPKLFMCRCQKIQPCKWTSYGYLPKTTVWVVKFQNIVHVSGSNLVPKVFKRLQMFALMLPEQFGQSHGKLIPWGH